MKTPKLRNRPALCRILIEARARAGLSQRQLAKHLGRAHSYVSKIEAGDRRVEVAQFMALARALGQDPKALLAQVQDRQREEAPAKSADEEREKGDADEDDPDGSYRAA